MKDADGVAGFVKHAGERLKGIAPEHGDIGCGYDIESHFKLLTSKAVLWANLRDQPAAVIGFSGIEQAQVKTGAAGDLRDAKRRIRASSAAPKS